MNLLLDTNVALWAITDSPKLSQSARELLVSPRATLWVSVASLWEISIKHSLGKGGMPVSGEQALVYFKESGYRVLPIEAEHAVAVGTLPTHHLDPFDRILVAQALVDQMRLVTHDATVALYGSAVIKI